MESGCDETRNVSHIHNEHGADLSCHFGERLEVDDARVGAGTRHYHLRPLAAGDLPHRVVIDPPVVADAVMNRVIQETGEIHWRPVRQVAALRQVESEDSVTRFE